jgi:hypothetical protein
MGRPASGGGPPSALVQDSTSNVPVNGLDPNISETFPETWPPAILVTVTEPPVAADVTPLPHEAVVVENAAEAPFAPVPMA